MYACEIWTIKKAEHWRIDAFELWCWRRLLRVPWAARWSSQSILKEISPGCSLEGLMLKLKLQNFGHMMRRADSIEKTLMLGKIEGRRKGDNRGWDGYMASLTQWTSMDISWSTLQESVMDIEAWHVAVHGVIKSRTWRSDWTELNWWMLYFPLLSINNCIKIILVERMYAMHFYSVSQMKEKLDFLSLFIHIINNTWNIVKVYKLTCEWDLGIIRLLQIHVLQFDPQCDRIWR